MHIGAQIIAPEGWRHLLKGVTYHFLRNDTKSDRVLLAQFRYAPGKAPAANLIIADRNSFENAAIAGDIAVAETQATLPPWLEQLSGLDLAERDRQRPHAAKLHQDRINERLNFIKDAVYHIDEIFAHHQPKLAINSYARNCTPKQNETRFRLWLLTFICFGRNEWSLLPPFHLSGHWKRENFPDKKFGAPSLAFGKNFGHGRSKELTEKCIASYQKRADLGAKMSRIYAKAMIEDFKCDVSATSLGSKIFIQPEGKPIPTYDQFKYIVHTVIGKETVQKTLYGAPRYRSKIARSKGRYTEEISNLMERVEVDAYYVSEVPKPYVEGGSSEAICVVTARDVLSGYMVGIGFSIGKERAAAYRMMLCCMALPKDFYCALWGIPFNPGDWVSVGLPGHITADRGPGSSKKIAEYPEKIFSIRGMTPSWSGQSKATVESSHPREMKKEGKPTYTQSALTTVQLAKREIISLMKFNHGSNIEDRMDPDSELAHVSPTPSGLWNHYDERFRNDAQPMSPEDAIRSFLTPQDFKIRNDGIYLESFRYTPTNAENLEYLNSLLPAGDAHITVSGFVIDLCIRHAWIEVQGRLIMLKAKLRTRGDEDLQWMSLFDLNQWSTHRRISQSAFRTHQHANEADFQNKFQASTGKKWDAGQRKDGRKIKRNKQIAAIPKKSAA
ncbi:transposase [Herbaspirillum camelliae]|uniref:transposase n=1 Tax=Herbaspirillum camelliae TaxID=1892903 RepID=UPI000A86FACA|nr:transposase [Herbaspirillum camelliae]